MNNKLMAYLVAASILFSPALFSGCMGSGDDGDTVPPEVTDIFPHNADDKDDIPVNTNITAVFSKSVINISDATFYLERVGSFGSVPATVSYKDATRTAVLNPIDDLEWDTIYVVTITSGVRSRAGVALKDMSWVFTVNQEGDTINPTITAKSPNQNYYVPSDGEIWVQFSERVNNVNNTTFYIKRNSDNVQLPATVSYNVDTYKATLTLNAGTLDDWTEYTMCLADTITDQANRPLVLPVDWNGVFTTNDTTAPSIVSHLPAENATGVAVNSSVSVTFSESLKSYTIHNNSVNFQLLKETAPSVYEAVSASVIYTDTTKTAVLYPSSQMDNDTNYRVVLTADVRDFAHNPLTPPMALQWDFKTADVPDTDPPTVLSKNPDDGNTGISTSTSVTAQFSENVTGVGSSSYTMTRISDSSSVSGNVVYNPSTKYGTFTPVNTLKEGEWYRMTLTSDIKDGANNALAQVQWTFKTADITKPTVVSKTPTAGAGNVGVNINLTAVFSEDVSGVGISSFTLKNETSGLMISGAVSYSSATRTATFNPDDDLPYDSEFTVTLTNAIADSSGNTLNTVSWTFQTGSQPDTTPPTVTSPTYPDHQSHQTDIPRTATVSVRFSEPVTGVGPGNVMLKKGDKDGALVNALVTYDPVSSTASVVPNNDLDYSTVYTVFVKGGVTTEIADTAGNKVASDIYWSFTTIADTTAPTVANKTPEQGTPDVPGNAVAVTVIFSERVQNVTTGSFKLIRDSDSFEVPSSVNYSYDPLTNTASATLTPLADVTVTGTYRVRLTNAITDMSANLNPLQTLEWTFSITALDVTAPTAMVRIPAPGDVNWVNKKVTVIFSEDVKGVSASSFYVKDQAGTVVPAVVTYSTGLLTAELEVTGALEYEKTYTAYLNPTESPTIMDRASNQLTELSWTFTTPVDTIAPTVTDVFPPNGTSAFPVNGQITATFSEPIQGYSSSTFKLDPAALASVNYDAQTRTLTMVPQSNLAGSTTYTVHVTTGIKDLATVPNSLASEYTWTFTTQNVADETKPTIVPGSRNPGSGATGVALGSDITLQFSEDVTNATSKIFLLKGGTPVGASVTYNGGTFVATINPTGDMDEDTDYTVRVMGGPTGVLDKAGNYLAATDEWTFHTEADIIPPTVTYRYPIDGAANVVLKPAITVQFSEPVTGVNNSSFSISGGGTYYVIASEDGLSATLTPGTNLANNTSYTVTLTSAIKDRAGNSYAGSTWSFTTNSLPVISDIAVSTDGTNFSTVADSAANVNPGITHLRLTFNRAMNTAKKWMEIYEGATGITPSPCTPGDATWTGGTVVTYTLTGRFKGGTSYQARLYGWGGSFEDTEGNTVSRTTYVGDGVWNFTTSNDGAAPSVSGSIPALGTTVGGGATNVGRNIPVIVIRFNEMMNTSRASVAEIRRDATGTYRALTNRTWSDGGRTVSFTIPSDASGDGLTMLASTAYRIRLGNGTSFRDVAGNDYPVTILYFTTGTSTSTTEVYAESFENYSAPNFTQLKNVAADSEYYNPDDEVFVNCDWLRISGEKSGNNTLLSPQAGSYMVKAAQWGWDYGDYADMENISSFNFSTSGTYVLTFQMFHERLYNMTDRLQVYASTDGTNYTRLTAGALTDVLRYDWSLGSDAPVWHTHYVNLSSYSGAGTVYLRLRAISAGELGGNVIMDNLKVTRY